MACGRHALTSAAGSRLALRPAAGQPTPSCGTAGRQDTRPVRRAPPKRAGGTLGGKSGSRGASSAGTASLPPPIRRRLPGWRSRTGPRPPPIRRARRRTSRWGTLSWGGAGTTRRPRSTAGRWKSIPGTQTPHLARGVHSKAAGSGPGRRCNTRMPRATGPACARSAQPGAPDAPRPCRRPAIPLRPFPRSGRPPSWIHRMRPSAPGRWTAWGGPTRPYPFWRRLPRRAPCTRSSAPACTEGGPTGWRWSGSREGRQARKRPYRTMRMPSGGTRARQRRGRARRAAPETPRRERGASSAPGRWTAWECPTRPYLRSGRPPGWTPCTRSSAPACTRGGPTGWRWSGSKGGLRRRAAASGRDARKRPSRTIRMPSGGTKAR